MAQLVLNNIDLETAEKLERRAKRLGTTPEDEAALLLRERLRSEPGEVAALSAQKEGSDPRFVRRNGFLVFTGVVANEEIPDHRAIREERIDAILKATNEDRF